MGNRKKDIIIISISIVPEDRDIMLVSRDIQSMI